MDQRADTSNPNGTLTFVPNKTGYLIGGIGSIVSTIFLIGLVFWALNGARQQRANSAGICQQLGDQASSVDLCKPNSGSGLQAELLLPAIMVVVCGLTAVYFLVQAFTAEVYTFDRQTGCLSKNEQVSANLREITQVAVNPYGRGLALTIMYRDEHKQCLGTYGSRTQANAEAERIANYLGVPVRKQRGWFQSEA